MALLQEDLKAETLVVEEKKAGTFALIESIGQEKGVVDEAVESSRADEEDAAKLQACLCLQYTPCLCKQHVSIDGSNTFSRQLITKIWPLLTTLRPRDKLANKQPLFRRNETTSKRHCLETTVLALNENVTSDPSQS